MAKKTTPKKIEKSKAKVAPKKTVSTKSVPVKKGVVKKPLPKAKAVAKAKTPVVKKKSAVKPKKVVPVKKSVQKPTKNNLPKKVSASKKSVQKSVPKSKQKVVSTKSAKKPAQKVPVKDVSKKPVAKTKNVSKALQRDINRRDAVNAKAAPKKIVSPKSTGKATSKKVETNVKKDKKISKTTPKPVAKKESKSTPKPQPKKATPVKKAVAKKPETKKQSEKKPVAKVEKSTPKKEVEKKVSKKEKVVGKEEVKEVVEVEPKEEVIVRSRGGKFRVRPSHNIYFSIDDLNAYFEKRDTTIAKTEREKKVSKAKATPTVVKPVAAPVPRQPLAVATVFDILGLNPVVAKTHDKLEEQDVPRKWKKYYKMLVDLRKHHSSGVEMRSEEVLRRSAKDDAGDLSSYGQHLADAGSESFERDIAYNIISNQKEILSEIDEAIKRIKNGTYGICEVTGKPIPESRLLSIPYTRCTLEGQQIKETEIKRQKANQRATLYDMADPTSQSVPSDEDVDTE